MKFEKVLNKGNSDTWSIWLKAGLFRADKGKVRFAIWTRPMFLFFLFIPRICKFWVSLEKDVISVMYLGFIKMPKRRKVNA